MKFYQRLAFFLFGLLIGVIFLIYFLGAKAESKKVTFCYLPNLRVLKDIRSKPFHYSAEASIVLAETWIDSVDIKNTLTNTKGQHLRLLLCSTYGEGESVTSGGIVESGQDYCSGEDKVGPRRRITTSFCAAFFHDAIEGRLPPNLFTKRGYLRALFNASPSEIDNSCNAFFTKKFYQGDRHGTNSKVVKGLETGMLKKKRSDDDFDSGSRTVVIESQETIQCMVRLTEGL